MCLDADTTTNLPGDLPEGSTGVYFQGLGVPRPDLGNYDLKPRPRLAISVNNAVQMR